MPAPRRVLVVEDSEEMRWLVVSALSAEGFEVIAAKDGRAAEAALEDTGPLHLVVLDLVLPEVGGYELLAKLGRDSRRRKTPVIVMSGEIDRGETIDGVAAVVHKPFEMQQLQRLAKKLALA